MVQATADRHDLIVGVGSSAESRWQYPLRLVELRQPGRGYRSLTNVLEPAVLPADYVAAL